MYGKRAGMTGTAVTEEEEFDKIYKRDVVVTPANRPTVREDEDDLVFRTLEAKFRNTAEEVEELHKSGQPALVGTVSIENSWFLSELPTRRRAKPPALNDTNHPHAALPALPGQWQSDRQPLRRLQRQRAPPQNAGSEEQDSRRC